MPLVDAPSLTLLDRFFNRKMVIVGLSTVLEHQPVPDLSGIVQPALRTYILPYRAPGAVDFEVLIKTNPSRRLWGLSEKAPALVTGLP